MKTNKFAWLVQMKDFVLEMQFEIIVSLHNGWEINALFKSTGDI